MVPSAPIAMAIASSIVIDTEVFVLFNSGHFGSGVGMDDQLSTMRPRKQLNELLQPIVHLRRWPSQICP